MITTLISLLVVATFAGIVYRFAPTPDERWGALLERYRPHAPMSDWSVAEYDRARQYSDIAAAYTRREFAPLESTPGPVRRRTSRLPDLANIPCRGETVQF